MSKRLLNLIICVLIGIISSIIAGHFGYSDILTWEHWSFFVMLFVPYFLGQVVALP